MEGNLKKKEWMEEGQVQKKINEQVKYRNNKEQEEASQITSTIQDRKIYQQGDRHIRKTDRQIDRQVDSSGQQMTDSYLPLGNVKVQQLMRHGAADRH